MRGGEILDKMIGEMLGDRRENKLKSRGKIH